MDSGATSDTTLGVIASVTSMSSILMTFWIISFSSSSSSPDSSATSAIAPTSSLETGVSEDFGVMSFWMNSTVTTMGKRMKIITLMAPAVKPRRALQWVVPMVLGMISANTRISTVVMALTTPKNSLPNTMVAWLPTPAAPMVLAIVFSESIAARGLEVLRL